MENYTPMESEFGSLEHDLYKLGSKFFLSGLVSLYSK